MSEKLDKRRNGFTPQNARAAALKANEARKDTPLGPMVHERLRLGQQRRRARERAERQP